MRLADNLGKVTWTGPVWGFGGGVWYRVCKGLGFRASS